VVAIPRSLDYEERRKDGYIEPEVVVLVGTAHISSKSAEEVRRVILSTRPRNVVVELCRSRAGQMYATESSEKLANPMSLAGEGSLLQTFRRSVQLGGDKALILRLMLASLSSSLQRRLNIENGLEFVAAREAAESINAEIVLGDRPIEISLQRAWDSLTTSQRISLLADLVKGTVFVGKADPEEAVELIEKLRMDDDMLSSMLGLFTDSSSEGAVRALLHERDLYLAWSLKRSKAVNGADVVVGVIGKGHLRGVCYALTHNPNGLRFRDIAGSQGGGNSSNSQNKLLQLTMRITTESILFLILWKIISGQ
jgi:pheromone shutdown protein TraB